MGPKQIATKGLVFRILAGSRLYGVHNEDSDYDYIGACIEPQEYVLGFHSFEQWVKEDKTETIYSLRKLLKLMLKGNPTVFELLWAPPSHWMVKSKLVQELVNLKEHFVSQRVLKSYLGYLHEQRERLEGKRGQMNVKRLELIEQYGYDTKYAGHVIRLAIMATVFGRSGRLVLPLDDRHRAIVKSIRAGEWSKEDVLILAENHEREIKKLLDAKKFPEKPNEKIIEEWMMDAYVVKWFDYFVESFNGGKTDNFDIETTKSIG